MLFFQFARSPLGEVSLQRWVVHTMKTMTLSVWQLASRCGRVRGLTLERTAGWGRLWIHTKTLRSVPLLDQLGIWQNRWQLTEFLTVDRIWQNCLTTKYYMTYLPLRFPRLLNLPETKQILQNDIVSRKNKTKEPQLALLPLPLIPIIWALGIV